MRNCCVSLSASKRLPTTTKDKVRADVLDLSRLLTTEDDRLHDLGFDRNPFRLLGYCEHNSSEMISCSAKTKLVQSKQLPSSEGPDYGMTDGSFSIFVTQDDLKAGTA